MQDSRESSSEEPDILETDDPRPPVKKPRSIYYEYFNWNDTTKKFTCKYCSATYLKDKTGSTSALVRHLKNKHLTYSDSNETKSLKKFLGLGSSNIEKFTDEGFAKKLTEFIVAEDQPFTIVESPFFRNLLSFCNPAVKIPGADTNRNRIRKEHEKKKDSLKQKLDKAQGKVSFVVDGWTAPNQVPMQGVLAVWITPEWEIRENILDFTVFTGAHSGINLSEAFLNVLDDFKLLSKILGITCDNASNMDSFCSSFSKDCAAKGIQWDAANQRVRCLAHILNLSCRAAIDQLLKVEATFEENGLRELSSIVDDIEIYNEDSKQTLERIKLESKTIIGKLRLGIIKIRASPQRRESFFRQCSAAQMKTKMLIRDNTTRWNSTFQMLKRASKLKIPLTHTLLADKELSKFVLSDEEWKKIEYIMDLLIPFKDMTLLLEKEDYPTMSSAMIYVQLFRHLESYIFDEKRKLKAIDPKTGTIYPPWIRAAAEKAYNKLDKYYPTSDGLVYVVGTILDPRCKLQWYKSVDFPADVISQYRKDITNCWELNYKPKPLNENSGNSKSEKEKDKNKLDLFSLQMKSRQDKKDELQIYLSKKAVPSENLKGGSLSWWKLHELEFPNLSKMARDYLAIPGTAASMERAFSAGPDLLSKKRQSLSGCTINECLCVKAWCKAENKAEFKQKLRASTTAKVFQP